jgi:hypothetical protein
VNDGMFMTRRSSCHSCQVCRILTVLPVQYRAHAEIAGRVIT